MALSQINPIAWDKLNITYRKNPTPKEAPILDIHGLDTETLGGYVRLIADSMGRYELIEDPKQLLKFLCYKGYRNSHNFWYNIQFDFDSIAKWLDNDNIIELAKTGATEFEGYGIKYIPKKLFSIHKSKHSYNYYDIAQFFNSSLEHAAFKYLGGVKNPDNLDRHRIGTDWLYWAEHEEAIIKYCKIDCELTAGLGQVVQDTFKNDIGFTPKAYTSKAGISKQYFRTFCEIPHLAGISKEALYYAFQCYYGGRFEVLERGNLGNCTLIDINSAYPYHIANLIDVTKGTWQLVQDHHESAYYGFYKARLFVPPDQYNPLPFRLKNGTIIYPAGEWTGFLTKEELEAYEGYIDYEIIRGYEFYPSAIIYPFREAINNLYYQKEHCTDKDHFRYSLYKILMNSIYGCFYEKIKPFGADEYNAGVLFNSIYATIITANTRVQEFTEAQKYKKSDVMAFATDSVLLKGKHKASNSSELGLFSFDSYGEAIVLRAGVYQIGNKLKNRGIAKADHLKTPDGNYKDIFDYIRQKPDYDKYTVISERPLHLKECVIQNKTKSIEDINLFKPQKYDLDINKDLKRLWSEQWARGGDIFNTSVDSVPVFLTEALA